MQSILKCCAGLDVHKMMVMATVQTEDENGEIKEITQSFKTYRRERRKLRDFLVKHQVELVVMEMFRRRQKLVGQLAGEKTRLHKVLDDAGIRLGGVVSDIHGKSAQKMIQGLIDGLPPQELVKFARGKLKSKTKELFDSMEGSLSSAHLTVLKSIRKHIQYLDDEKSSSEAASENLACR